MNVLQRMQAPKPKFFRVLRTIGLTLATVGGALLTAPIALPAAVITVGSYLTVAGTVITAVSQTVVSGENDEDGEPPKAKGDPDGYREPIAGNE